MEKVKAFLRGKSVKVAAVGTALMVPLMASALAADTPNESVTAITTALTGLKGDVISMIAVIVGIAIAIFAAKWLPKAAMSFFKSIASK